MVDSRVSPRPGSGCRQVEALYGVEGKFLSILKACSYEEVLSCVKVKELVYC